MSAMPGSCDVAVELEKASADFVRGLLNSALVRVNAVVGAHPYHPQALVLAGKIAIFMRKAEAGLPALQRAVDLAPRSDARIWLSLCLEQLDRKDEALEQLEVAIACLPQTAGAHFAVGLLLEKLKQYDKAARLYLAALALDAGHVQAQHHHGRVLHAMGHYELAVKAYRASLERCSTNGGCYSDYSATLSNLGRFDEACRAAAQAATLDAHCAEAQNNLGHALLNLNRSAEAAKAYERATVLRPGYAKAYLGQALALLKSGDFQRGWAAYEWRWRTGQTPRTDLGVPVWQGEALEGRTILLHSEQGFGDTLQFVRLAPLVAARGGRVILQVPEALVRLLRSVDGVERIVAATDIPPPVDLHCPMASLPHACSLRLETVPSQPYIRVPPEESDRQGSALRRHVFGPTEREALVVGLVWAGDPRPHDPISNLVDSRRSITLETLSPLFAVEGVRFVSLQLGEARQQIAGFGRPLADGMEGVTDFADTAARMAGIDLLVSVDTSMVHLAGALGMPVWMLSRFDGCWRWLEGRDDTPWYPTMRIFRQPSPGDWPGAISRVAEMLRVVAGE